MLLLLILLWNLIRCEVGHTIRGFDVKSDNFNQHVQCFISGLDDNNLNRDLLLYIFRQN